MDAKPALVRPRFASAFDLQVALWLVRMCLRYPAAFHELNDGMYAEDLRFMVGVEPRDGRLDKVELRAILAIRAKALERQRCHRTVLSRNVGMLGKLVGLDAVQQGIVAFTALVQQHPLLAEVVGNIHLASTEAIVKLLSHSLSLSEPTVRKAIHPDGPLLATGILRMERSDSDLDINIVLPHGLRIALFTPADNIQRLMAAFLEVAPPASLNREAFDHLMLETELLAAYLTRASDSGVAGVNILIYGPPGTGKTEYVRWLAEQQRKHLFQVRAMDDRGDAISGADRLAFYQLSQRFLRHSKAWILFDEIEDIFPIGVETSGGFFQIRRTATGKMFINRLLESNPVPAIWIANDVEHIDKAYLRRFDFSFEMSVPPVRVRRAIVNRYLRGYSLSDALIVYLSQQDQLSPAQIEKAAKVLKLSGAKGYRGEATVLCVIENSMALLDQARNDALSSIAEGPYQLDYLNLDCDLTALIGQLKRAPDAIGAICFYGPPGTGKTALAHYLARAIERPLVVRRASDILSPYVGETEQNIASMFRQAQQDGALLLLDEADSFLSDRRWARNSWEVTGVNEMLTQMERFDGLFICSTNLMQRLDAASLRRFALRIKFDYLKPEQRWRLFLDHVKKIPPCLKSECRAVLNRLDNLTPGDFATVRRQATLLNVTLTAKELLGRLILECQSKGSAITRPIGFIFPK